MLTRRLLFVSAVALLCAKSTIGSSETLSSPFPSAASNKPLLVTTSFSILADLVQQVGGEHVLTTALVGADGDVHVYQPSPADVQRLAQSQLIVVNGLGLEGWMDRLVATAHPHAHVVVASHGVAPRREEEGGLDPHAWQSVPNVKIYIANILAGLIGVDSQNADYYRARAATYTQALDTLDHDIHHAIASIPPQRRKVVTTHDAFGYFSAAYDIPFYGVQGMSTEAEASARDVTRLITLIRREKAPAVFLENMSDKRLMQQISAETGAKIGGVLYADALSPPSGPAASYLQLMRHNVAEIVQALKPAT